MKKVRVEIKPVTEISETEWGLIQGGAGKALSSSAGLKESILKREFILIFHFNNQPAGIATVDFLPVTHEGKDTVAIFTGNTFIHPAFRGKNFIQFATFKCYLKAKRKWPFRKIFWYYGSNGFKSYLLMVNNFKTYWPHFQRQVPDWEQGYLDKLTKHFYDHTGSEPIPAENDRSFTEEDTRLSDSSIKPELVYYRSKNPCFPHGEKLPCLGPLTLENMLFYIAVNPLKKLMGGGPPFIQQIVRPHHRCCRLVGVIVSTFVQP